MGSRRVVPHRHRFPTSPRWEAWLLLAALSVTILVIVVLRGPH